MSFEEHQSQASEFVRDLAGRLPGMAAIYPKPPDVLWLGLVSVPVESIACWVAVGPGEPPQVTVSFEAIPLYCPGPFYMIEPIGRSWTVKHRFRSVRFPQVDVSPAVRPTSLAAVSLAVEKDYPRFRTAYGTPDKLIESLRWEENIDCWEAFAYSLLEVGRYEDASEEFRKLDRLPASRVDSEDMERLPELQSRANAAIRLIWEGPEAVAAFLATTREKKLAAFGLDEAGSLTPARV